MEALIALGFVTVVGIATYLVRRDTPEEEKQKPKRDTHPLAMGQVKNSNQNRKQRQTNNMIAFAFGLWGLNHLNKKKYDKAIHWLSRAVKAAPKCTAFYINRGLAYQNTAEFDLALADFNKVIELDVQDWLGHNNRASVLNQIEQFDDAIHSCNQAIDLYPEVFNPYMSRGIAYMHLGDHDSASMDFFTVISIAPDNHTGHILYSMTLMRLDQYQEAFDVMEDLLEVIESPEIIYNNRAWFKAYLGDYEGSLEDIELAISLAEESMFTFFGTRGHSRWLLNDYEGALADFSKADELFMIANPKLYKPTHKMEKSIALFKLAKRDEAVQIWKEVTSNENSFQSAEAYQERFLFAPAFYATMQELEALANAH